MNNRCLRLLAGLLIAFRAQAAAPPAQKLLPRDTLLVVTVPDRAAALKMLTNSDIGQLWRDPAMKPFVDKFNDHLQTAVLQPLEHQLGIHLADYLELWQGQLTFALLPLDLPDPAAAPFASVIILDTGDHAAQLATNLAAIRKKWMDAGKNLKTETIRGVEFAGFITSTDELSRQKLLPALADTNAADDILPKPPSQPVELLAGRSGSLLLVSQSREAVEKILARQEGGLIPPLDDSPAFQNDFAARLRDAPVFVWLNAKSWLGAVGAPLVRPPGESGLAASVAALATDGAMGALGFNGLTTASAAVHSTPRGLDIQFFVGVPESARRGLLNILATEARDASPPPFIPGDAVKFSRVRFDFPAKWRAFEATLGRINPDYAQLLNYVFNLAGKDKDEKYNLRSELLDNLGDDLITYERSPVNNTLGDLKDPPGIFLVGSPNPERLAAAVRVALGLFAPPDAIKEREFLGRRIYSVNMAVPPQGGLQSFQMVAGAGYLAFSGKPALVEEFLRGGDGQSAGLDQTPGLRDAAQAAGGFNQGIFSFDNDKEAVKPLVETLRHEQVSFTEFLLLLGLPVSASKIATLDEVDQFKAWMDFSLLPPSGQIARYFNFSVWAGGFNPDGFALDWFTPALPASD